MTLEPVDSTIEEAFDVDVLARGGHAGARGGELDLDEEPDPEPIVAGQIAVGRVVFECLAAAIDPFPRKPDATLDRRSPAADGPRRASRKVPLPSWQISRPRAEALSELGRLAGLGRARAALKIWLSRSRNRLWSFVFGGSRG